MTGLSSGESVMSNYMEVDYDKKPTELYRLIEKQQWCEVVSQCEKYPDEVSTWIIRKDSVGGVRWKILPIHAALIFRGSLTAIEKILSVYPDGTTMSDDQGMLPLHLAFRNDVSDDIINFLLSLYPEAKCIKDGKDRTPLDHVPSKKSKNTGKKVNQFRVFASEMARRASTQDAENHASEKNFREEKEEIIGKYQALEVEFDSANQRALELSASRVTQDEYDNLVQDNKVKTASLINNKTDLEAEIERLQKKCTALDDVNAELKSMKESSNYEHEKTAAKCEKLSKIKSKTEELENDNSKLRNQIVSLQENVHDVSVVTDNMITLKEESASQKKQICNLVEEKSTLEEHLQNMLQQEEAMIKTYDEFEKFNEDSRGKLMELMQRNESNKKKVAELTSKNNLLVIELRDKGAKHSATDVSREELEKRVQTLMERLDDVRNEKRSCLDEINVLKNQNSVLESEEQTRNENYDSMKNSCEEYCNLMKSLTEKLENLTFEHVTLQNEIMQINETKASIEGDLKISEEEVLNLTETNRNLCKKIEEVKSHHSIERESHEMKIQEFKEHAETLNTEFKSQMDCQHDRHEIAIEEMKETFSSLEKDHQNQIKRQEEINEETLIKIRDNGSRVEEVLQTQIREAEESHKRIIQDMIDQATVSEENLKAELRELEKSHQNMKDHEMTLDGNLKSKVDKENDLLDVLRLKNNEVQGLSKRLNEQGENLKKFELKNSSLDTYIKASLEREKSLEETVMEYDSINKSHQNQLKNLMKEKEGSDKLVDELVNKRDNLEQELKSSSDDGNALKKSIKEYDEKIVLLEVGQSEANEEIDVMKLKVIKMNEYCPVLEKNLELSIEREKALVISVEDCKLKISMMDSETFTIKSENKCREDLIESMSKRSSLIEEEMNEIKAKEEALANAIEGSKKEIDVLTGKITNSKTEKENDSNTITDLQMELNELSAASEKIENELKVSREEYVSLTAKYETKMEEVMQQNDKQFNDLKDQELLSKEKFEVENRRLKDEIYHFTKDNTLYGKKVEELTSLVINVQHTTGNEKSKLNEVIQNMNEEISEHKITLESARKQKYANQKTIDNLKEKLEAELIESSTCREKFEETRDAYMALQESASEVRGASSGTILGLKEAVEMWRDTVTDLEDQLDQKGEKEESLFAQLREISFELVENKEAHASTMEELNDSIRNRKIISIELEQKIDVMKKEYESVIDNLDKENEAEKNEHKQHVHMMEDAKNVSEVKSQELKAQVEEEMETMKKELEKKQAVMNEEHEHETQLVLDAKSSLLAQFEALKTQFEEEKKNMTKEHENDLLKLIDANSDMLLKLDKQMNVMMKDHENQLQSIKDANKADLLNLENGRNEMSAKFDDQNECMKKDHEVEVEFMKAGSKEMIANFEKCTNTMKKDHEIEVESIKTENEDMAADVEKKIETMKENYDAAICSLDNRNKDLVLRYEEKLCDINKKLLTDFEEEMDNIIEEHRNELLMMKNEKSVSVAELENKIEEISLQHEEELQMMKDAESEFSIEFKRKTDEMMNEHETGIQSLENANKNLTLQYDEKQCEMTQEYETTIQSLENTNKDLTLQCEEKLCEMHKKIEAEFEEEMGNVILVHNEELHRIKTENSAEAAELEKSKDSMEKEYENQVQSIKAADNEMTAKFEKNIDDMRIEYESAIHSLQSANKDLTVEYDQHLCDMKNKVSTEFQEELENIMKEHKDELHRMKNESSILVAKLEDKIDVTRVEHEKQLQIMKGAESELSNDLKNQMVDMRKEHNQEVKMANNSSRDVVDHLESQLKKMARQHDLEVNKLKLSNKVASTLRGHDDNPVIPKFERDRERESFENMVPNNRFGMMPGADFPEKRSGMAPEVDSAMLKPKVDTSHIMFGLRPEGNTIPPRKVRREPFTPRSRFSSKSTVTTSEAEPEMTGFNPERDTRPARRSSFIPLKSPSFDGPPRPGFM